MPFDMNNPPPMSMAPPDFLAQIAQQRQMQEAAMQQQQQQAMMQQQMAQQASQMPTGGSFGEDDRTQQMIKNMQALRNSGMFDAPKQSFMDRIGGALMAGGDSLTGTHNYSDRMNNQAKLQEQRMQMMQKIITNGEDDPAKLLSLDYKKQAIDNLEENRKIKNIKAMGDDLDASKSIRSPLGVGALGVARAQRIEGLINQYPNYNVDRREMVEMAIGLNSLLQGSNMSAQHQVMDLVPKSIQGNIQKINEWISNNPQGLNQQKFVQRMLNDVKREKTVMQNQVYDYLVKKVPKYNTIREKYPDDWQDIVKAQGIDPDKYDEWRKGGFKKSDVVGIFNDTGTDSITGQGNGVDDFSSMSDDELRKIARQ